MVTSDVQFFANQVGRAKRIPCNRFASFLFPIKILAQLCYRFHFPSLLRLVGTITFFLPLQDVFLFDKNPMGVTD
jgi:hypothetical protein